ncbi:glycosyltransferase [Lacticaseibacillus paracasei]|uniref:Glycosyltransferase n=1 Tax=Lacticaseibacillus paracasei TaxID=1597 RepID=A0AAW6A617_LACPA|nr:glycosyltransferase [Lacticaseibacillus paracasei]MDB1564694.1 glycosyltransferase [Lacticaseibacillus paracasei]
MSMSSSLVQDFYYGASKDYYDEQYTAESSYGMHSMRRYFDSGVMVIDVQQYNKNILVKKLLEIINTTQGRIDDQAIINVLSEGRVKFLPWRYNYQHDLNYLSNPQYHWAPELVKPIIDDHPNILVRQFTPSGPLALPYNHVQVTDEWDLEFWRLLEKSKRTSLT